MTREPKRHPLCSVLLLACLLCLQTMVASRSLGQSSAPPATIPAPARTPVVVADAPASAGSSTTTLVQSAQPRSSGSANVGLGLPESFSYGVQNARSSALVVLTSQAKEQDLAALTEDLNIMCRVFDRALSQAGLRPEGHDVFTRYFAGGEARRNLLGPLFGERSSRTECLYVQGYGPLFLVGVDFPLRPPETADPAEPNVAGDALWNQVAREMAGRGAPAAAHSGGEQPQYSAEKVLSLRSTLTRALKHATNIKGLSNDSGVTVVAKAIPSGAHHAVATYFANVMQADPAAGMYAATKGQPGEQASLLAIRATVKDIADFASGSMNLADFEKRLESAQY